MSIDFKQTQKLKQESSVYGFIRDIYSDIIPEDIINISAHFIYYFMINGTIKLRAIMNQK